MKNRLKLNKKTSIHGIMYSVYINNKNDRYSLFNSYDGDTIFETGIFSHNHLSGVWRINYENPVFNTWKNGFTNGIGLKLNLK